MDYQAYLRAEKKMTLEEAETILSRVKAECADDDSRELFDEMLCAFVRYANIRAGWNLLSKQEKMDTDSFRTSAHDSVIIKVRQLHRYLVMSGLGRENWYEQLGYDENDPWTRKRVGDFACYVALFMGLGAR